MPAHTHLLCVVFRLCLWVGEVVDLHRVREVVDVRRQRVEPVKQLGHHTYAGPGTTQNKKEGRGRRGLGWLIQRQSSGRGLRLTTFHAWSERGLHRRRNNNNHPPVWYLRPNVFSRERACDEMIIFGSPSLTFIHKQKRQGHEKKISSSRKKKIFDCCSINLTCKHFSHLDTSGLDGLSTFFTSAVSRSRRKESTVTFDVSRVHMNELAQSRRTSCTNSSMVRYLSHATEEKRRKGGGSFRDFKERNKRVMG